jgi:HPt (histidine-containing phosphotransfer) domain-containing protein
MTESRGTLDTTVLVALRESVGDDPAFLAELVGDFLADAPDQLVALRSAAGSGDAPAAMRAAHTLKGNSRTFGAMELAACCQDAETAARAGDLDDVLARLDAIEAEWGRVDAALVAWRDG